MAKSKGRRRAAVRVLCLALLFAFAMLPVVSAGSVAAYAESTTPTGDAGGAGGVSGGSETTTTTAPTTSAAEATAEETLDTVNSIFDVLRQLSEWLNPMNFIENLMNGIAQKLIEWAVSLSNWFYTVITTVMSSAFFRHEFITGTLSFFKWLTAALATVGFLKSLLTLLDRTRHGEYAAWQDLVFSIMRTYGMILLCEPVVKALMEAFNMVTDALCGAVGSADLSAITGVTTGLQNIGALKLVEALVMWIFVAVVSAIMVYRTFQRFIVVYIQIATGYFSVYDIMSGNNVIGEWARDVVAGFVTYGFQIFLYRAGMTCICAAVSADFAFLDFSDPNLIVGLTFLFGVSAVPIALRKLGYTAAPSSVRQTVSQAVGVAGNALIHLAA